MMGTTLVFLSFVHLVAATSYMPPRTAASNYGGNIVLDYMDSRSATIPLMMWNQTNFERLIGWRGQDLFFDTSLLLGLKWNGKDFWPGQSAHATNMSDWETFAEFLFEHVPMLDAATASVYKQLGVTVEDVGRHKVIIMIPYPDTRQRSFGVVNGRVLDFAHGPDRVAAVEWYVQAVVGLWRKAAAPHLSLVGFYWFYESAPPGDAPLLQGVSDVVHALEVSAQGAHGAAAQKLFWIPYFGSHNFTGWKGLGVDVAMLQPNYAFQPVNATKRFGDVAKYMEQHGMGIEFEISMDIRGQTPWKKDWQMNLRSYAEAAVQHRWLAGAMKSFYYGNSYNRMYGEFPEYYDLVYRIVAGAGIDT